eukprot:365073-Chlamydomonas_euryale.AAC.7
MEEPQLLLASPAPTPSSSFAAAAAQGSVAARCGHEAAAGAVPAIAVRLRLRRDAKDVRSRRSPFHHLCAMPTNAVLCLPVFNYKYTHSSGCPTSPRGELTRS